MQYCSISSAYLRCVCHRYVHPTNHEHYLLCFVLAVISVTQVTQWIHILQEPISLTIFARNSNSIELSPCCNSVAGHQIATNFCAFHDSTAVVSCTKFCSDHGIRIEVSVKRNFHRIWIAIEKPLSETGPWVALLTVTACPRDCKVYLKIWVNPTSDTTKRIQNAYSMSAT